ncbi:MAG: tRNA pseudouridine(38-40) synthase TruA [Ignavibacteriae bacterium]|nr:tRNA pseudouridine(38-40) synthase TruA [Ignavibacteriota bacterium]
MTNYRLTIEYDGVDFNGWQRQKNTKNTIQEFIESSLKSLLKHDITLIGAGRTDSGVSALNQVANFKSDAVTDKRKLIYSLNSMLPETIFIKDIKEVSPDFHSRYSAKKREYIYRISLRKKALEGRYYHRLIYNIDFRLIDRLIEVFTGYKSFRSLCKNPSDKHNFFCNVSKLDYDYRKRKEELIFRIISDRFLHSMVRGVLGCLTDVGRGRLDFEETKNAFNKGEKIKAVFLPGNALFLKKIYY